METAIQRRVPATTIEKPAGAAASVFDAGRQAKQAAQASRTYTVLDPAAVVIKKGVPLPPASRGAAGLDRYGALLKRMEPGYCAELTEKQAKSLLARARKLGVKVTTRVLPDGKHGVWRLA